MRSSGAAGRPPRVGDELGRRVGAGGRRLPLQDASLPERLLERLAWGGAGAVRQPPPTVNWETFTVAWRVVS